MTEQNIREKLKQIDQLQVLRFWNSKVADNFDGVCWTILSACRESDPAKRGRRITRR